MPTGYTANMYEGRPESFEDFVLSCARGMGAFVMQRDDPHSDKPALRKVSDYYFKRVGEAEARLAEWEILDDGEKYEQWREYAEERDRTKRKAEGERKAILERYEKRLAELELWPVPPMLESFKEFMVDQVKSSIEFDCSPVGSWYDSVPYDVWLEDYEKGLHRDIEYYSNELNREVERVKEQNTYTYALYNALGMEYND